MMYTSIETSVVVSPTGVFVESGPTLDQTGGAWWYSISRNAANVSGITGSAEMAKQYTLDLATSYFLSLSNQKKIKSTCLINLAMKYATTI